MRITDKSNCSGCGLCAAVCPFGAVSMTRSEEDGFLYPVIDGQKCTFCGKCMQACPMETVRRICCEQSQAQSQNKIGIWNLGQERNQEDDASYFPDAYAIQASEEIRRKSSSGGIFSALGMEILRQGGAVCGVAWGKDWEARHLLISEEKDFFRLQGTKYVQSRMDGCYQEIEEKLWEGRKVLFCGTPCQCAAVKIYCQGKGLENELGGLILVDLLCRGVPSYKAFRHWLDEEEGKENAKALSIRMKEKEHGWANIGQTVSFGNGREKYYRHYECLYVDSFLRDDISVRECCFHCPYKSVYRNTDLTIGDFWGYKNPNFQDDLGTSAIMVNSQKGKELLKSVKESCKLAPTTSWRIVTGNFFAFSPLPPNSAREEFFRLLDAHPFSEALALARDCRRIREQNPKNVPASLDAVTVGTTQGWYAFDYSVLPLSGYNMARYLNPLCCNGEILRYNRGKIRKGAVILITLQYPIFLYPSSRDISLQTERLGRAERHLYRKEMEGLDALGKRNFRMNHEKAWEIDRELAGLISSWEREMGLPGIVYGREYGETAALRMEAGIQDCEDLVGYCRKMGWVPVLIGLPYSKALNEYMSETFKNRYFYEAVRKIREDTSVCFADYSSDARLSSIHLYRNVWFLNDRGRKYFTKLVYEEVMKER